MFPTEADIKKSYIIEENKKLFLGEYTGILQYFKTAKERKNNLEVIVNLASTISNIFADLMFLEEPEITVPEAGEKQYKSFAYRNDFDSQLHSAALTQSYAGKTAFEIRKEDNLCILEELDPSTVFERRNPMNVREKSKEIVIAWGVEIGGQPFLFMKTHVVGEIRYQLFEFDTKTLTIGKEREVGIYNATLPPIEKTGLDRIPVFVIENPLKGTAAIGGVSDYKDLRSPLTEFIRVLSQIASQLKKHGDAKVAVPEGVLDEKGLVKNEDFEMVEIPATGAEGQFVIPQYITNPNSMIEYCFKEKQGLIEDIARISDVAGLLFELNVSGGVEKVGALRLRMLRTLAKVKRKLKPFKKAIADMIAFAVEWETNGKVKMAPEEISMKFKDGLPEDVLEKVQINSTRLAAGFQTIEDAIRDVDKLKDQALTDKVAAIKKEQHEGFGGSPQIAL